MVSSCGFTSTIRPRGSIMTMPQGAASTTFWNILSNSALARRMRPSVWVVNISAPDGSLSPEKQPMVRRCNHNAPLTIPKESRQCLDDVTIRCIVRSQHYRDATIYFDPRERNVDFTVQ